MIALSHQWHVPPPRRVIMDLDLDPPPSFRPPPQVPVVQFGDEVLVGSSAIMSRVAAEAEASQLGGKKAPTR